MESNQREINVFYLNQHQICSDNFFKKEFRNSRMYGINIIIPIHEEMGWFRNYILNGFFHGVINRMFLFCFKFHCDVKVSYSHPHHTPRNFYAKSFRRYILFSMNLSRTEAILLLLFQILTWFINENISGLIYEIKPISYKSSINMKFM